MSFKYQRMFAQGVVSLGVLLAASGVCVAEEGTVSGSASYRERIALPAGAVFEAVLEDVSRAGAAAEQLGITRLEPAGSPPYAFRIAYTQDKIVPGHRYAVRARILLDGKLLMTTDTLKPVITNGQTENIELVLRPVGRRAEPPAAAAGLLNTYWKLIRLEEKPITVRPGQREPYLLLRPGSKPGVDVYSGCNRISGQYVQDGAQLKLDLLSTSLRACLPDDSVEHRYLNALAKVVAWRISDQQLTLINAEGTELLLLESRYLR